MDSLENIRQPNDDEILEEGFFLVMEEFEHSMAALQLQDLQTSQQSLFKAKNVYNQVISITNEPSVVGVFNIPINFIEVSVKLLKSTFLTMEERYESSLKTIDEAKETIELTTALYSKISDEALGELGEVLPMFKGLFYFFEAVIDAARIGCEASIKRKEGRFVDEIETLQAQADRYKQISLGTWPSEANQLYVGMISMLNRFAEINEKKIEKIKEKRKEIQFMPAIGKEVFIVHGHDKVILGELKEILQKEFGLEPIILNKQPDRGDTVIEKFENYARHCAFAFVILTPDDFVENNGQEYYQGRPNALYELGWFCGRLGRKKVRILRKKDTNLPSDLGGIVTIDFNDSLEEVFRDIRMELQDQGLIEG